MPLKVRHLAGAAAFLGGFAQPDGAVGVGAKTGLVEGWGRIEPGSTRRVAGTAVAVVGQLGGHPVGELARRSA